jgi:hypothetical protein
MTHHPDASTASHDLREAVARALYEHDNPEPRLLWPPQISPRLAVKYRARADAIIAGPIASELARLTRERDEAARRYLHWCGVAARAFADNDVLKERALVAEAELAPLKAAAARDAEERVRLRGALEPFMSGPNWGAWLSWIISGAPDRVTGKAAAKQIVNAQVAADAALTNSEETNA